ncbi:hypothetical protein KS43_19335, partial [Pectobacterium odoriferum]
MARYNTNNPVPSTAMQDLSDNAQIVDEFVNSIALTTLDRLGVERYTLTGLENLIRQVIGTLGWIPAGTFEAGATLTDATQTLKYEADGNHYRWDGDFPKAVPASSSPASTGGVANGAWVNVTDLTLRAALAGDGGAALIGTESGNTVQSEIDLINRHMPKSYTVINSDVIKLANDANSLEFTRSVVITGDSLGFNGFGYPSGWGVNGAG